MAKAKTSITTENRSGSAADAAAKEQRTEMPLSDLHPFEGHPFKVLDDELMEQTVESIKQIGAQVAEECTGQDACLIQTRLLLPLIHDPSYDDSDQGNLNRQECPVLQHIKSSILPIME